MTNYEDNSKLVDFYNTEASGEDEQVSYGVLSDDLLKYCKNIENTLSDLRLNENKSFDKNNDSVTQIDLLVTNVFEQLDSNELVAVTNGDCSRVIEKLLRESSDYFVIMFADRLSGSYPDLFRHQFASHVCQTILYLGSAIVHKEINNIPISIPDSSLMSISSDVPKMSTIINEICEQLAGQWDLLAKNVYASHVLRTLIHILAGDYSMADSDETRSKKSRVYNYNHRNLSNLAQNHQSNKAILDKYGKPLIEYDTPESFKVILDDILKHFYKNCEPRAIRNMAVNSIASPVIQLIIKYRPKDEFIKILLDLDNDNNNKSGYVSAMITDKVGSHLLEKIITSSNEEIIEEFYFKYIETNLLEYVRSSTANFVVQQIIEKLTKKDTLKTLLLLLSTHFEEFIKEYRQGVVCKVIQQSCKRNIKVDKIVEALGKSLNSDPSSSTFIISVLYLKPYDKISNYDKVKLQGSLILQSLCNSKSKIAMKSIIDGVLDLSIDELIKYCRDPVSSRFIESIFTSKRIPDESKQKIIIKLLHKFGKMSADKYASHIVDKCWAQSNLEIKEKIAEDIEKSYSYLITSVYGKIIVRNFKIEIFKRSRKEWINSQVSKDKKRKMFEEILQ